MNLPSSLMVSVLTISGFVFPAVQTVTSDETPAPPDMRSDGARVVQIDEPTVVVATEHEVLILQFSERIVTVNDIDEAAVEVDAVAGQPAQLLVRPLRCGTTSLRFVLDGRDVVQLTFVFCKDAKLTLPPRRKIMMSVVGLGGAEEKFQVEESNFEDLQRVLDHIDPENTVQLMQAKGGVLMKGAIHLSQMEQAVTVAECFFPSVVNQMQVTSGGRPAVDAELANQAEASIPDDASELPDPRSVSEIRADIRRLHEDVRAMIQMLEQEPAVDQPPESAVRADAQPTQTGVLYFRADYCGPSRMMDAQLERWRAEDPVTWAGIIPINVENDRELSQQRHVDKLPTFVAVVEGEVVERLSGLQTESQLRRLIRMTLPVDK